MSEQQKEPQNLQEVMTNLKSELLNAETQLWNTLVMFTRAREKLEAIDEHLLGNIALKDVAANPINHLDLAQKMQKFKCPTKIKSETTFVLDAFDNQQIVEAKPNKQQQAKPQQAAKATTVSVGKAREETLKNEVVNAFRASQPVWNERKLSNIIKPEFNEQVEVRIPAHEPSKQNSLDLKSGIVSKTAESFNNAGPKIQENIKVAVLTHSMAMPDDVRAAAPKLMPRANNAELIALNKIVVEDDMAVLDTLNQMYATNIKPQEAAAKSINAVDKVEASTSQANKGTFNASDNNKAAANANATSVSMKFKDVKLKIKNSLEAITRDEIMRTNCFRAKANSNKNLRESISFRNIASKAVKTKRAAAMSTPESGARKLMTPKPAQRYSYLPSPIASKYSGESKVLKGMQPITKYDKARNANNKGNKAKSDEEKPAANHASSCSNANKSAGKQELSRLSVQDSLRNIFDTNFARNSNMQESKRDAELRQVVETLLMTYEKKAYCSIEELQNITNHSQKYVKRVLNELCDYDEYRDQYKLKNDICKQHEFSSDDL